jgi:hypothetical protein
MRAELALVLLAACETSTPCPSGMQADAARVEAIVTRLGTVSEGRALLEVRDRIAATCFATPGSASVITSERIVILASDLEEGEASARLGHLLAHVRDGLPTDAVHSGLAGAACDAAVDRALRLEARAYVIEVSLQEALHARPTTLAFEFAEAMRAAPTEAREAIALAYLRDHPHGAAGIDGLADAYRARCR